METTFGISRDRIEINQAVRARGTALGFVCSLTNVGNAPGAVPKLPKEAFLLSNKINRVSYAVYEIRTKRSNGSKSLLPAWRRCRA